MVLFLIKKTFFDMWDNLFKIVLINLGYFIIVIPMQLLISYFSTNIIIFILIFVAEVSLFCIYTGVASKLCKDLSDYEHIGFKEFYQYLKETVITSIFFALCMAFFIIAVTTGIIYYSSLNSFIGTFLASSVFWLAFFLLFALQYFYPIQSRLENKFRIIIKKMFYVFFDNKLFSFGLFFSGLIILGISIFTAFLIPGFASVLLLSNVAFKLRLLKYDYLEKNPDADRKKIPWRILLTEERERVGKRTFKGMIFPWKE